MKPNQANADNNSDSKSQKSKVSAKSKRSKQKSPLKLGKASSKMDVESKLTPPEIDNDLKEDVINVAKVNTSHQQLVANNHG